MPQLAAYILKLEQKLRGVIDWGDDDANDARAAWLQRVRPQQCPDVAWSASSGARPTQFAE